MCSLIRSDLSSFHGSFIQLDEKSKYEIFYLDNALLMAADCSHEPKLAVFVNFLKEDSNIFDKITIWIGDHQILIHSNYQTADGAYIEINKKRVMVTSGNAYLYPPDEKIFDYK